jgi:hypothetical protein
MGRQGWRTELSVATTKGFNESWSQWQEQGGMVRNVEQLDADSTLRNLEE